MNKNALYLCFFITLIFVPKYTESGISKTCLIKEEIITNSNNTAPDGFGSQFQEIICAVIYAELNNKKYVYTPFTKMDHNYNNDPDFIARKEQLINFIGNFEIINENHVMYENINHKAFFDANVVKCAKSLSLKKIKKIFRANKDTNNYFKNKNFNIAIHLRRPNPHDSRISGTNLADNLYYNIINKLRIIYSSKKPIFHLYSQGNSENFAMFNYHDTILHLNESVEDTFTSMVLADVLVAGTSSFSHTAAILSENIVYYIPFMHVPLPHWISVDTLL